MDKHRDAAQYDIRIQQHLGAALAALFPELTLHDEPEGTRMHGELPDQAALHGVLERIRDLGLTLIAVVRLPAPDSTASSTQPQHDPEQD